MESFFFDIETCGAYPDFETFEIEDSRGTSLFKNKYEKMYWKDKWTLSEAYLENAPIVSTFGKICCISFGFIANSGEYRISSFCSEDERCIVENFNDLLKKIEKKNFNLSGFRIVNFDIPWILHKLHKYGISPASIISPYGKKPWEMRIVDISEDWKGKFAWAYSFDEVAYQLGIDSPKDKMSGSEVHNYYWNGKLDNIKEYCEKDVSTTIQVSKKIYG